MHVTRPKKYWIPALVLAMILLGAGLYTLRYHTDFGAPALPSFVGYKPSVLPAGIHNTGQSLIRSHNQDFNTWDFSYNLAYTSNELRIYEGRTDPYQHRPISCRGLGGVCNLYQAVNALIYQVWYGVYNDKPFDITVSFIKTNTVFHMEVANAVASKYVQHDWTPMINSLQPVNLTKLPVISRTVHNRGV